MCNLYDIGPGPQRQARGWQRQMVDALERLPKRYAIRRTDPALVVLPAEGGAAPGEIRVMRWGFVREFSASINNARSDKLDSGIWRPAWEARRCVIPVGTFYEWSGGEKGAKQTYALRSEQDEWLWVAGLWEENAELGPCFAMITTEARGPIRAIHDRMPAILPEASIDAFLSGVEPGGAGAWLNGCRSDFRMFPCLNPLKAAEPGPPVEDAFLL